MIRNLNRCCKDCTPETGRSVEPNCHMTCEKYLKEKEKLENFNKLVYEQKQKELMSTDRIKQGVRNMKNKSGVTRRNKY